MARHKKNPGLDKLLDFRFGVVEKKGVEVGRENEVERERKREDEGN